MCVTRFNSVHYTCSATTLYCTVLYSRAIKDLIADSIPLFITGLFEFSLFFSLSLLAVTFATEIHPQLWIFLFMIQSL